MIQGAAFWPGLGEVYFLPLLGGRERGGPLEGGALGSCLGGPSPWQRLRPIEVPIVGGKKEVDSTQQAPGPNLHHQVVLGMGKAGSTFEQIRAWNLADLRSNPHPSRCGCMAWALWRFP